MGRPRRGRTTVTRLPATASCDRMSMADILGGATGTAVTVGNDLISCMVDLATRHVAEAVHREERGSEAVLERPGGQPPAGTGLDARQGSSGDRTETQLTLTRDVSGR